MMVFSAMIASIFATAAFAESRLATVASSTACETAPVFTSFDWRSIVEIGLFQRRLVVGKVRLLDRGVELNELGALLHVVAAVEEIGRHLAAELRGHLNAFDGEQRADRMHPVGPALGHRFLGRHRCGWRHHLADELGDHLRLEHEVEIADPAEEHGDDDAGNDEALDHDR